MADALGRYVGEEAGAMMGSPSPSWSLPEVRALVGDAGLREMALTIGVGSMCYPSPEEFVRREAVSSPLAGPLESLARDDRDALIRDVGEALRAYADDDGVDLPIETSHVAANP